MSKRILTRLSILGITLLAACGQGSGTKSQIASTDAHPSTLLIFISGHDSCGPDASGTTSPYGMAMYQNFAPIHERFVAAEAQVTFLLGCFTQQDDFFYIGSDQPHLVYGAHPIQMRDKARQLIEQNHPEQIFIVGFSYGGWTALKLSHYFAESRIPVHGLYTIDPISYANCNVLHPRQCRSAPLDIYLEQYASIGANSRHWLNFFQTETVLVHSSAIYGAMNFQVAAGHTEIDNAPWVWAQIQSSLDQLAPTL